MVQSIRPSEALPLAAGDWEERTRRDGAWVAAHRAELAPYEGQWIAIHAEALIAHDEDGEKVLAAAKARGITDALVLFIYPPDVAFA